MQMWESIRVVIQYSYLRNLLNKICVIYIIQHGL